MNRENRPATPESEHKNLQIKIFDFIRKSRTPQSFEQIADEFGISIREAEHHCNRLGECLPIEYIPNGYGKPWGWIIKRKSFDAT
jgi:hypothetical protein